MGASLFSQSLTFFVEAKHRITEPLHRARQDAKKTNDQTK